ncbi:MAG: hypothetical protein HKP58_13255, partial [Desulfatitalea sp.]|nr:hypothetical protein [Desulfatitalea sp.]NNK01367.1 hypothetical protein [Desulfatitalea sp.]
QALDGLRARVQVKDLRDDKKIFGPTAANDFKQFNDRYHLAWTEADKERLSVGETDLQGLFQEAFEKRLELLGVEIAPYTDDDAPQFQILLNTMKIDLKERKWMVQASYEANLSMDNQLVARQIISGSAERVKIVGRKGADTTLSEIFTDVINKLDIVKLFRQAKWVR